MPQIHGELTHKSSPILDTHLSFHLTAFQENDFFQISVYNFPAFSSCFNWRKWMAETAPKSSASAPCHIGHNWEWIIPEHWMFGAGSRWSPGLAVCPSLLYSQLLVSSGVSAGGKDQCGFILQVTDITFQNLCRGFPVSMNDWKWHGSKSRILDLVYN